MQTEIVRGHVDLLLLASIARSPAHGYGLVEDVRRQSDGAFDLAEGSVYPALYRLEGAGLVSSSWRVVEGRRRREYRLTRAGRSAFRRRAREWTAFSDAMQLALA
jgi:PadR family transcriptional regulator